MKKSLLIVLLLLNSCDLKIPNSIKNISPGDKIKISTEITVEKKNSNELSDQESYTPEEIDDSPLEIDYEYEQSIYNKSAYTFNNSGLNFTKGGTYKFNAERSNSDKVKDVYIGSFYYSDLVKYQEARSFQNYSDYWNESSEEYLKTDFYNAIKYCNYRNKLDNLPLSYNEKTGELLSIRGEVTKNVDEVIGYRLPTVSELQYILLSKSEYSSNSLKNIKIISTETNVSNQEKLNPYIYEKNNDSLLLLSHDNLLERLSKNSIESVILVRSFHGKYSESINDLRNNTLIKGDNKNINKSYSRENISDIKTPVSFNSKEPSENNYDDIREYITFNGRVFDQNSNPVEGAIVTARSIEVNVDWVGEPQKTINGAYVFRNSPGESTEIKVEKKGWTTRYKTVRVRGGAGITGDPNVNVFNFGGNVKENDHLYAIQNEPQIISIKINDRKTSGSGSEVLEIPEVNSQTNISGIDSKNLKVEIEFSEPVDRSSVENAFKINSMVFDETDRSLEINKDSDNVSFFWNQNDTKFTFNINKPLLANNSGDEARYNINFSKSFKDLEGNESTKNKIRFTESNFGNNVVFSIKSGN